MSFGEPKDIEGKCNARLHIADDFGDNHATMRCELPPDHVGPHTEIYLNESAGKVRVQWDKDARFYSGDQRE